MELTHAFVVPPFSTINPNCPVSWATFLEGWLVAGAPLRKEVLKEVLAAYGDYALSGGAPSLERRVESRLHRVKPRGFLPAIRLLAEELERLRPDTDRAVLRIDQIHNVRPLLVDLVPDPLFEPDAAEALVLFEHAVCWWGSQGYVASVDVRRVLRKRDEFLSDQRDCWSDDL